MKFLIIHTAFIGDIVLSTPLVSLIKKLYPESEIHYLTTGQGVSILKNNPKISKLITYDKRGKDSGLKGILKLGKKIRKEKYDQVIIPHRYFRSSFLAWISGSKIRKGYDTAVGSFLFTEKIPYNKTRHEVERILTFFEKQRKNIEFNAKIELYPSLEDKEKVDELLIESKGKILVAIAPGSKWFTKKWPVDYFNKVIEHFQNDKKIKLVIIGGQDEKGIELKLSPNVIDLRAKTTLLQLGDVLSRCTVVLTNDSSPIHIASAYKKCCVLAIFGPTVRKFGFYPWSKNSFVFQKEVDCRPCGIHGGKKCPKKHFKCMLEITPQEVIEKIESKILLKYYS